MKVRHLLLAVSALAGMAGAAEAQGPSVPLASPQAMTSLPQSGQQPGPLSLTVPANSPGSLNPLQPRPSPQAMTSAPASATGLQPPAIGAQAVPAAQALPAPPALNTPAQEVSSSDLSTVTITAIMDGAAVLRTANNSYQVADKGMLSHNGRLYGVRVKDGVVTLFDRNQRPVFEATVGSGVSPEQRFSWTRAQSTSGSAAGTSQAPAPAPLKTP